MDINKHRRITRCLLVVWIVTFLMTYVVMGIIKFGYESTTPNLSEIRLVITTILVVFCLIPLLWGIRRHSKIAGMTREKIVSTIFLIHHAIWAVLSIISFIF